MKLEMEFWCDSKGNQIYPFIFFEKKVVLLSTTLYFSKCRTGEVFFIITYLI